MDVLVRPLRLSDITRAAEIERQAFPTLWPPTPFNRELDNRLAKYLVAACQAKPYEDRPRSESAHREQEGPSRGSLLGRLMGAMKGRLLPGKAPVVSDPSIVGFVGLWFMSGEAHITAIAVEESWRGNGIGELLLIGSIELARERHATVVSLEARVSNYVAQSLYEKYGFKKMGIRKGYYTDNREDAVIMTTSRIDTPAYQEEYQALRVAYRKRHGEIRIALA